MTERWQRRVESINLQRSVLRFTLSLLADHRKTIDQLVGNDLSREQASGQRIVAASTKRESMCKMCCTAYLAFQENVGRDRVGGFFMPAIHLIAILEHLARDKEGLPVSASLMQIYTFVLIMAGSAVEQYGNLQTTSPESPFCLFYLL